MKKIMIFMFAFCMSWNTYAFDLDHIQIHGFVSQGYIQSDQYEYFYADTNDGTFEFNEFGLNFSSQLTDSLRLGLQLLSRDLGEVGNNEVSLDWAFGDYRYRNWLGFRAGKMKMPMGLYNQSRDIDAARSSIFLPSSVYNEVDRSLFMGVNGIGLYGELPFGVSFQTQYGELDAQRIKDLGELSGREIENVSLDDMYSVQLLWQPPLEGLLIGGSLSDLSGFSTSREIVMGPPGTPPTNLSTDFETMRFWIASVEYTTHQWKFVAEYYQSKIEINMDVLDLSIISEEQGYYGSVSYQLTDWFEVGTYYSVAYPDKDDKDGARFEAQDQPAALAWLKDFVVSTRFDINESWIVKLEGHLMNGLAGVGRDDEETSEDWFLAAAKVTYSF